MLTNAHVVKGTGPNQTELVQKSVLKIEEIWLSTTELIQALDRNGSLNSLEKRQLSVLNGHLVTLRAILVIKFSSDVDGNFISAGGVISTDGFNIMMSKINRMNLPVRLPYPQGHVLSHQQGLSAAEYTHRNG